MFFQKTFPEHFKVSLEWASESKAAHMEADGFEHGHEQTVWKNRKKCLTRETRFC